MGHRCHIVALSVRSNISISIISLTLHLVSPNSTPLTPLFHHSFLILPLPSQLAFAPYPSASSWRCDQFTGFNKDLYANKKLETESRYGMDDLKHSPNHLVDVLTLAP